AAMEALAAWLLSVTAAAPAVLSLSAALPSTLSARRSLIGPLGWQASTTSGGLPAAAAALVALLLPNELASTVTLPLIGLVLVPTSAPSVAVALVELLL